MANAGDRHTNGSQFFITFNKAHHLDCKNVVCGQVVSGFDALAAIQGTPVRSLHGQPQQPVTIVDAAVVAYGPFAPPKPKYVVEGTPEAAAADLNFDLVSACAVVSLVSHGPSRGVLV